MFTDIIIKNSAPIVTKRIDELITEVAKKFQYDAFDISVRLKLEADQVTIHVYHNGKKIKTVPFDSITGNVGELIENHIKKIFLTDAQKYSTDLLMVNYVLSKDRNRNTIFVHPYINKEYKEAITIKQLLSN